MLDVSDIKLLQKVTELGSINKAADELYMSQPTLSKRISRLEQTLNVKLFFRHSSGMQPTDVTNYLIKNGQLVQAKLDSMCRHVERLASLEGGKLNIGVGPIIEQLYFPKVLLDFVEQTSQVKTLLKTANASELLTMTMDGHLDVAVGPFNIDDLPNELISAPVQGAPIVFVARPEHPLFSDKKLNWDKLKQYPVIAPDAGNTLKSYHSSQFNNDFVQITCDNYTTSKSLVKTSDFITAGPRLLFSREIQEQQLAEIPLESNIYWQSSWIARREAVYTPTVNKFIKILESNALAGG
ncbi:LysR family transcriptional regulator [Vibrio coralliilyticus]|uniref:LysR family transcriptional regulator n=1 Tax=Vibrio coralliilyticus TaxID=190893 RepID=UPI0006CD30ED|nr:LysR family transcriptional regulator [Vibrio coralliilyticus]AXN33953.1 LysR family transcriptional regulator [Vibrio coralliilyticus]KPH24508.1 LysR family transcriptional regulator [Vibrio coralliilyticus]